eukprot:c29005_g1_i1 orf=322-1362(-)
MIRYIEYNSWVGLFSLILAWSLTLLSPVAGSVVGINYGLNGRNLPSSSEVVNILKSNNVGKVRIFDASSDILEAFANSGITLIVGVPNGQLESISSSQDNANQWVQNNIVPYASTVQISYIAVGNEVLINNQQFADYLFPAIQNIYNALGSSNLQSKIQVSTTHSTAVLDGNSYPPSHGNFQTQIKSQMTSILGFLSQTGAPFMANVYPFFAYISSSTIDLQYALFGQANGVDDSGSGKHYSNLFDAQMDTLLAAMKAVGYSNIPILVTETGWPTQGNSAATVANAKMYNGNLVNHVSKGTPERPGVMIEAYIFEMFNEDLKTGEEYEKYWGVFNADGSKIYDITL